MFKIPTEIIWTILAILGGVSKQINQTLNEKKKFDWRVFLSRTVVSGFSGYMFAQTASILHPEWALVAAGIGGYMGSEAIDFIVHFLSGKMSKYVKSGNRNNRNK